MDGAPADEEDVDEPPEDVPADPAFAPLDEPLPEAPGEDPEVVEDVEVFPEPRESVR